MASVEISNVKKYYGKVLALSDMNLSIPSGSFHTLLGPSGCGKTTLLRTIAGFHFQDTGTISIDGKAIQDLPAHRRDVGMVFQDYAVFPHLSVRDNVAFGLKQRKVDRSEIGARVAEALRMTQMQAFIDRMPHELSGGQQQRVGLARALAVDPTVLLMDEPLSNLDAKLRVDLRAELRRIQQDMGMTTVYVTHDQEEALAMSDTVCVMYQGVIQQAAAPYEIYKNPANKFVANFVGTNNFIKADLTQGGRASIDGFVLKDGIADPEHTGIVAAIRPEDIRISTSSTADAPDEISISANVQRVSFIGREAEVSALNDDGEEIKAIVRPTSEILSLGRGSAIRFGFSRADVTIFADADAGRRLS